VRPLAPGRWLLAVVVMGGLSAGAAFGGEGSGRQRVTADDDPIVLPVWVAAPELTPKSQLVLQDPETTGSVKPRQSSGTRGCERVAWYPERAAQREYREVC
jgi:hypothetical protein